MWSDSLIDFSHRVKLREAQRLRHKARFVVAEEALQRLLISGRMAVAAPMRQLQAIVQDVRELPRRRQIETESRGLSSSRARCASQAFLLAIVARRAYASFP